MPDELLDFAIKAILSVMKGITDLMGLKRLTYLLKCVPIANSLLNKKAPSNARGFL